MFRLPTSSNQSPIKKITVTSQKSYELCKFPHRKCNLLCLESYEFCLKHILEDKSAPYKPCPFIYTVSGKKCGKPAHRPDRRDTWFCAEHSRKTHLIRQKTSRKRAPPPTQEALLASLSHYARKNESGASKNQDNESDDTSAKKPSSKAVNPFVEVDASQVNARCSQVLDYASDSDSDVEAAMLDTVWRAQDHESSDAESVDSQAEDPLKHAGIYTAEEVTVVIKDKMIRLQSLYIDQFRRLHHLLKERKRKYLHALKKEKETLCSIHDQEKNSAKEQKLYQKLKALNHFHKYYGEEAVLHKKALEKRAQMTEGTLVRTSHKGKCAFTEGGVKCGAKTLPVTKYCRKHILEDTQQVLFRACGFKRDDHTCQEPTLNVFENATCIYHITLPAQPHNALDTSFCKEDVKEERESEQKADEIRIETTLLTDDMSKLPSEDVLQPDESTCALRSPNLNSTEIRDLESVSPPSNEETLSTSLECTSADIAVVEDVEIAEAKSAPLKGDVDQKMNLDNEAVKSIDEEHPKHENADEDLVMVDMITDVGVVEEVLESETKSECEESMQIGPQDDNS